MDLETEKRSRPVFDMKALVSGFPHMSCLTEADDAEILRFVDGAGMSNGGFSLLMQRQPRYFDLFRARGGVSRVLGLREDSGRLVGTGALTSTPCYIGGVPGRFVYLADLRIQTADREMKCEWRDLFGKILADGARVEEAGENARLVCVIIEGNERARRTLEERVHAGQRLLRLAPYQMITLLGRSPLRRRARSSEYTVERGVTLGAQSEVEPELPTASAQNPKTSLEEIESFLESVHRRQAFGQRFGAPYFELRRRLHTWADFSVEDFFVVRDRSGRIVACTALWNPNPCKQSVITGPWWTRAYNLLAAPLGLPQFGKPLEIVYFTHLSFAWDLTAEQRREAFAALTEAAWPEKRRRRAHALAFCDFEEFGLASALRGYVKAPVKVGMYMAVPEVEYETFKRETLGKFPPAFELALV